MELIFGAVTGAIFGVLLQKAEVLRFDKQVGFLILKDATILKFMFTAILVGAVGIYACLDLGIIELKVKSATLAPIAAGGVLFGIGWAIAGFCPGTAVGAVAEGRVHALWAVLGMLVGAGLYAEAYPHLKEKYMKMFDYGTKTIPELTGMNHWLIIGILAVIILLLFVAFEKS